MKTFRANVTTAVGIFTQVRIQAENHYAAQKLLEAQYGHGRVSSVVQL